MAVDICLFDKNHGVVLSCHGALTGKELIAALNELFKGDCLSEMKCAIIDETAVKQVNITTTDIHSIIKQQKQLAVLVSKRSVIAIVAPSLIGFGLARMWESLATDIGWSTKTFKSRHEADIWVRSKMKEIFDITLHIPRI